MKLLAAYLSPHPPVVLPPIGGGRERECQRTLDGIQRMSRAIEELAPDNIIVITPHGPLYRDAITIVNEGELEGNFGQFGNPELSFRYENNLAFTGQLQENAERAKIPTILFHSGMGFGRRYELDHGVMVPLGFLNWKNRAPKLIPINYGLLTREELFDFGRVLLETMEGFQESFVVIASGDLSHALKDSGPYAFREEGPLFDQKVVEAVESGDFQELMELPEALVEGAQQCGYNSLLILAGLLSSFEYDSELISYEGPFGVGYGVGEFRIKGRAPEEIEEGQEELDPYVDLAVRSIENYAKTRTMLPLPEDLPLELMQNRAGVFVSIHSHGQLRGCIGTISPTKENVAMEIIHNAVSASAYDPRFYAVSPEELEELEVSVDVLGEAEPASFADLDPKRFGVIVTKGRRRGLLLPELEGVDTAQKQVEIALEKAGIHPEESYELERFEVIRHI